MAGKKRKDPTKTLSYKALVAHERVKDDWSIFKAHRATFTHGRRVNRWVKKGRQGPFPKGPKHWWWPF